MTSAAARRVDNLPADLIRFVGRRAEAAAVKRLLAESRLVTLTGVGGVGKTRLAIHVARQVRAAFSDGVCLVTLADLATTELLPTMVMSASSATGSASVGVEELVEHLASRELMLVLDNCEHLTDACVDLVMTLLRRCPALRVLATSRERLRVEGETVYVVPPLPVPAEGARLQPGDLIPYDALAHFVGRATALHAEGRAEVQDAEAVATPCRRLDGLPLAIELVAGRTATLPVKILAQRSDDQLPVLSLTGSRSAPTRHHMLRAALEYSYALCSERARLLWSRLSVFAGGATLESVLDVCADGALPRHEFESALTELAHKSIVSFEAHRYRMSVSIRAFGRERLLELGEEPCLRSAHRDHFASMAGDPHAVLSPRTVEGHVQNILVKLGSTSRTQIAAAVAQQAGAADGAGLSRVRRTWVIADDRRALNPQRAGADPTRSVNTCNLSHQELA